MPKCGSQITCCDLPIRLDSYRGCGFECSYCYGRWHGVGFTEPRAEEGVESLRRFIAGERRQETSWCDWPIPLHFGGISDPFQPCEKAMHRSREFLEVFSETYHPVVISTKSTMLVDKASPEYLKLLGGCNAVLQVSMVSPDGPYTGWEREAPSFLDRFVMLSRISRHVRRLIVRVQPYTVKAKEAVLKYLPAYAASGVHGITIEGMKRYKATEELTEHVANVMTYPESLLYEHYEEIRAACHEVGLRFYCAENRLRYMSDHPSCCGVDFLEGFLPNRANLNYHLTAASGYDPIKFTAKMKEPGTGNVFRSIKMETEDSQRYAAMSYKDAFMELFDTSEVDKAVDRRAF